MYIEYNNFVKLGDMFIPKDPRNSRYQEFMRWIEAGNTPIVGVIEEEEPKPDPIVTAADWLNNQPTEVINALVEFVQNKGQV